MTARIEALVDGVFIDLWDWARLYAESEGIELADLVNRALDAERRRIGGLPRLDSRTMRPGQRGANAQMAPGELSTTELERVTGATGGPRGQVARWRAAGLLETARPTRQGIAAAYGHVDVVVCFVLVALELLVGPEDERLAAAVAAVRGRWADRGSLRDLYLTVAGPAVTISGPELTISAAVRAPCGAVYNLGAVEAEIDRRLRG